MSHNQAFLSYSISGYGRKPDTWSWMGRFPQSFNAKTWRTIRPKTLDLPAGGGA